MPTPEPDRISTLRALLDRANRAYYVDASPTMPDSEFDALLAELADLESRHPELADPTSPTVRVGGEPIEGFTTVRHARPMLSIDNTYSAEDVGDWWERMHRELGIDPDAALDLACDPKIDGVAISLRYEGGTLTQALTRGDGVEGDDVTHAVRTIRSVPLRLHGDVPEVLEVRGEAFIPNDQFDRINDQRTEDGLEPFMNPRNACAGTLKQLDPIAAAERKLGFLAHGRGEVSDDAIAGSHAAFLDRLGEFGIPSSPARRIVSDLASLLNAIDSFASERHDLPYLTDGMVIRLNDFTLQSRLGMTSKSPRWVIAFKYPAERKRTVLTGIDMQVGKTGKITPRAVMEPVLLSGTTVRHATLHNFGRLLNARTETEGSHTDIRLGDTIEVEKAGEIIPYVVRVVVAERPKDANPIAVPDVCPECDGPVEVEPPEAADDSSLETARRCVNPQCPAQLREKLVWFAGRKQMDIEGLAEKTIDQILESEEIPLGSFADLFRLTEHREALAGLERMGEKKLENLLAGVDESKDRPMAKALGSLGIRHIGTSNAKLLARKFETLDALLDADVEAIAAIEGFGPIRAEVLHRYLRSDVGRRTFDDLRAVGLTFPNPDYRAPGAAVGGAGLFGDASVPAETVFTGKRVVLTGTLERFERANLAEILEGLGARVSGSVSSKTDLLIAGVKAGSKRAKAESLGVEIWEEPRLIEELERAEVL